MLSEELVERAAIALFEADENRAGAWGARSNLVHENYRAMARTALTIATPIIRAEAFEEAAKVADRYSKANEAAAIYAGETGEYALETAAVECRKVAQAIRSLKPSVSTGEG